MPRWLGVAVIAACGGQDPCVRAGAPSGVTIACVDDLGLSGFRAVGPAVSFEAAGGAGPYRLIVPADATEPILIAESRRGRTALAPITDVFPGDGVVTFTAAELATYQAVVSEAPAGGRRAWRALAGISMGGGAAAGIALRQPERWDVVGELGGEPGPSMRYSLTMFQGYLFGGFCAAGGLCVAEQRPAWTDLHELTSDFEHMVYQSGEGVGLTLRRSTYLEAMRDIMRALGNPASYNPESPYLPPGVPASYLEQADKCQTPVVLDGFFDGRYNPDGALPVITFCDGGDSAALGLGVFDGSLAQTDPVEVLLAVDRNGNGRRDAGEPVLLQPAEPFADVGSDGLADAEEPGYDAATNRDPNGDDFHPLQNPLGSENNAWRDEGEAYEDVGLDGVAGTPQLPAGYDYGEGDGRWTVNPNVERWLDDDGARSLAALDAVGRARLSIYIDAGIRDFLNSHVSAAVLAGQMQALGMPLAIYDDFGALVGGGAYDATAVRWAAIPPNVFVRYGNPAATPADIEAGDGRHVGTITQVLARLTTFFYWMDARWPDGDRGPPDAPDQYFPDEHFTSPTTGRDVPYAVFLPPGYRPEKRFPVVYFLHGYGQRPDDLLQATVFFSAAMGVGKLQKMILVFADGRCRAGDGCETGTFFRDSPLAPQAQMETHLYELGDVIDARFSTREPQ